jgi:hypothetical protein
MSSQRKIDSARPKGAESHGSPTTEGRQISAENAVTHGLYAPQENMQKRTQSQMRTLLPSVEKGDPTCFVRPSVPAFVAASPGLKLAGFWTRSSPKKRSRR